MQCRDVVALMGGAYVGLHASALNAVERAVQSVAGLNPEESARNEDFWLQIRHAFTVDRNSINLNNGSVCPAPRPVQKAMEDYWAITNMSPSLYVDEMLYPQIELIRRRLAAAFGCDAEELAITRNTTEALEIVQFGMELRPGDEIPITTQDYPSMMTTWRQRERRDGVVLKSVFLLHSRDAQRVHYARRGRQVRLGVRERRAERHLSHQGIAGWMQGDR